MKTVSDIAQPSRVLDIGCGTGDNLLRLCENFPNAEITGLDLSEAMLSVAGKKLKNQGCLVDLVHRAYDQPLVPAAPFDLLVFSYSLSMFNPGWEQAIDCAYRDLDAGRIDCRGGFSPIAHFLFSNAGWLSIMSVWRVISYPGWNPDFALRSVNFTRPMAASGLISCFSGKKLSDKILDAKTKTPNLP